MLNKELKRKLHSIALKYNITDLVAEKIVRSPFLFQSEKLKEGDLDNKTNFYHKYIGKFYIKLSVLKKLRKYGNR